MVVCDASIARSALFAILEKNTTGYQAFVKSSAWPKFKSKLGC